MRIGVTGASGFLGSRLVRDLAAEGYNVRAISREPAAGLPTGAAWVRSPDLTGPGDWSPVLDQLDAVVHAAARVHVMNESTADPLQLFRAVNVAGTLRVAEAAAAAGVRRFVFVSSIKVNGEQTSADRPFRAADRPQPADPYGVSKLEAEKALTELGRKTGLEIVIVRPVLVYGPGVRANFRSMMAAIARGIPLPLGRVHNVRSLIFVGNLSDLIIRACNHPQAAGQVFLASDGEDLSTAALVRRVAVALGCRSHLVPVPIGWLSCLARLTGKEAVARRLLGSLTADIADTRQRLDWTPPFTVNAGLAETARWFRAEQGGGRA